MAVRSLLLAGLIALTAAPASYAAFAGQNGRIAFERGRNVWTMNPDGGDPTQLTTGGGTLAPAFSPDGRQIAFQSGGDIVVMSADGSNPKNITAALGSTDQEPSWSPDGRRIAFSRGLPGATFHIWAIGVDGTDPVQLTSSSNGDFAPAWSPDGRRIAYTRTSGSTDIYTVDPSQPGVETFYAGTPNTTEDTPSWSPDGAAVAFTTNRQDGGGNEIYEQVGAGGPGQRVTNNPSDDRDPSWSPDGTRIAFTSNRSGLDQVWAVDAHALEGSPQNVSASGSPDSQPDWGIRTAPLAPPPPEIGESVNAKPVKGTVRVAVPPNGGSAKRTFAPLETVDQLPMGSVFDTRKGTVKLTFDASVKTTAKTQSGNFHGGLFITKQSHRKPLAEMRLTGGSLHCTSGATAARKRGSRRLFARAHGRFRTRGRHSTATVRGTKWLTKDTCSSTTTVVQKGTVVVRDLVKHRSVKVKAGHRYVARARKR